jgi:AcrR family transcriptional regulator
MGSPLLTMRHEAPYCVIVGTASLALVEGSMGDRAGAEARSPARLRLIDAMLSCIERQGLAKTTLDDVARQAGLSRATLYRIFPGGKESLLQAVVDTEVARLLSDIAVTMGQAGDLESALSLGICEATTKLRSHEALAAMLEIEPEVVLPKLAFSEMERILAIATRFVAPFLARWLAPLEAERIAEWATRIVVSYFLCPSEMVDLAKEVDARSLVQTFVMPAVAMMQQSSYPPLAGPRGGGLPKNASAAAAVLGSPSVPVG